MTTVDFPDERWFGHDRFDGYGSIAVVRDGSKDVLALRPMSSTTRGETHAALMTSARCHAHFDAIFADVVTIEQLRQGDAPNPWERAWLLWRFVDLAHFYYFILKANGWELGKADPAFPGGQRFLATGDRPRFPVGCSNTVRVRHYGTAMTVHVDDQHVTTFEEHVSSSANAGDPTLSKAAAAYPVGRFGFYCEDAHVHFGGFRVLDERGQSPPS